MLIENAVICMKSILFTKIYVQKYFPLYFILRIVIVYMYITLFNQHLNAQVCTLGHQNIGVCEISHTYLLGCLR